MAIDTEFSISTPGKVIDYTGAAHAATGATYWTVLEFHRWLQNLADDASSVGNDYLDISRETPTDKQYDTIITLINGYTLTAAASEHLYGGSIIVGTTATDIWDGIQILSAPGCVAKIIQDNVVLTNDFWNSIPFGTGIKGLNPDATNGISHRFMLKVRSASADIDLRRLVIQTREWGKTYSEFKINATGRGINVVPLTYANDLNNTTSIGTIAALGLTNLNQGYNAIDVNNDGANEYYYSKWDKGANSITVFYEYMKWISRTGSASTTYGINGELFRGITHQLTMTTPRSGTFAAFERVTWTGGEGQMLAVDVPAASTKMWLQHTKGAAPTTGLLVTATGGSGATGTITGTVVEKSLSQPFCGICTGTALLGAYGFSLEYADLAVNDRMTDLVVGSPLGPPNNQSFSVTNLIATGGQEDYVLVGPASGGVLQVNQFTANATYNGTAVTSIVVTGTTLPADTPNTGFIRIQRNSGIYTSHAYSARNTGTGAFTITSTNFLADPVAATNNIYIAYIDQLASGVSASFSATYASDRSLYVRVRNGKTSAPIKTFETVATFGSSGGTVSAVRASDL